MITGSCQLEGETPEKPVERSGSWKLSIERRNSGRTDGAVQISDGSDGSDGLDRQNDGGMESTQKGAKKEAESARR